MNRKIFIKTYIDKLINTLNNTDISSIEEIIDLFDEYNNSGSGIYFIGNGGSAATVSHMVNDFGTGLKRRGLLNLNVVSLVDSSPVLTAVGNDIGFENIYYIQLKNILQPNDIVFAVSCSGNSPNILKAVNYSKSVGAKIVGVTGFDGGKLKEVSDINFHIPTSNGEYGLCEDLHMILDHIIYSYYTRDE